MKNVFLSDEDQPGQRRRQCNSSQYEEHVTRRQDVSACASCLKTTFSSTIATRAFSASGMNWWTPKAKNRLARPAVKSSDDEEALKWLALTPQTP